MSKGGRYAKKKEKKGGNTALIVTIVVLVLIIAGMAGLLAYKIALKSIEIGPAPAPENTVPVITEVLETKPVVETTEETTEATTVETEPPYKASGKDIINILIVGDSARKGETKENSHLADTMILVTVNKNTKTMTLSSFLRDTYVQLPTFKTPSGKNRINVCYQLGYLWGDVGGAMQKVNECIKDNFGIEVDYNVEIDFDAFIQVVDMLGGVYVELTQAEADYLNNKAKNYVFREIPAGPFVLEGSEALAYARMRKAAGDADSDIKRTARQRTVITNIVESVRKKSFSDLQKLIDTILPAITTNMTNDDILTCMWELLPLLPELKIDPNSGTIPIETTYWPKNIGDEEAPNWVLDYDKGWNIRLLQPITEDGVAQATTEPAK